MEEEYLLINIALVSISWLNDIRFFLEHQVEQLSEWLVENAHEASIRWWGWLNRNPSIR